LNALAVGLEQSRVNWVLNIDSSRTQSAVGAALIPPKGCCISPEEFTGRDMPELLCFIFMP
jgi:hypothetical protein